MNERTIEDVISALYDMVQDARAVPLNAGKCVLEREKVLDMLDEAITLMPGELKEARTIVESRNELVAQARREAETVLRTAQEKAAAMVEQETIYQETKRQCEQMVLKTKTQLEQLRKVSNDYMDDALRRTEEAIDQSLSEVRDTRAKFRALIEAQAQRAQTEE